MSVDLTKHAINQAIFRFGWSVAELYANTLKCLEEGRFLTQEHYWIRQRRTERDKRSLAYGYNGVVYIFDDNKLVTVFKDEPDYVSKNVRRLYE